MKRNIILVVILFALMAGYYLFRQMPKTVEFVAPSAYAVDRWDKEALNRMTFTFPDQEIDAVKEGLNWEVNGFLAEDERMMQLLDALDEAKVTSKVSTNPENHERFEIGDSAVTMQLYQGDELVQEALLGKSAGGQNIYTRLPEEDTVYILSGLPAYLINEDLSQWRERSLLAFEPSEIRSVTVSGNADWELVKTEEGWELSGREVDEGQTATWLENHFNLQVMDFLDEDTDLGRSIAEITVERGTPDNLVSTSILSIHRSSEENKYQVQDANGFLYHIAQSMIDPLLVRTSALRDELTASEE